MTEAKAVDTIHDLYPDLDDLLPWTWNPWSDEQRPDRGGITTPNGRRADGSMHTYWLIAGEVYEPHGRLICEAVNAWSKHGWRARLGRWLLTR